MEKRRATKVSIVDENSQIIFQQWFVEGDEDDFSNFLKTIRELEGDFTLEVNQFESVDKF